MNRTKPPKYVEGAKLGDLTVITVGDWGPYNPETKKIEKNGQWRYQCECACGSVRWYAQKQLREGKYCQVCAKIAKSSRWHEMRKRANDRRAGILPPENEPNYEPIFEHREWRTGNERIHIKILRAVR